MLKTRIIPCLLLKNWGIEKSIRFREFVYIGSPINAVRVFNGRNVDELILVDIIATRENRAPPVDFVSQIAEEACMPLTVGGGIKTVDDVSAMLRAGADRVVINSHAISHPELIRDAADVFGSQCIVVSIDAKRHADGSYEVMTHNGSQPTGREPLEYAKAMQDVGAGEILLNSIDRDGTMEGFDIPLIRRVADALTIPLIACGGAGSVKDLAEAVELGHASAVAAGAFFLFYGKRRTVLITYPTDQELMAHLDGNWTRKKDSYEQV
jgi:cyclase